MLSAKTVIKCLNVKVIYGPAYTSLDGPWLQAEKVAMSPYWCSQAAVLGTLQNGEV